MELVIQTGPAKALRRMPKADAEALLGRLKRIAADPFGSHPYVKPVYGEPDAYRVRHGDWRALYRVDREQRAVTVYLIDNRKDVYR